MSPIQKIKYLYDYMHSEEYINDIEKIKAQMAADDSSQGGEFRGRGEEDANIDADNGKQDAFNKNELLLSEENNGIDTDNTLSENYAVNADSANDVGDVESNPDGVDEVGGVGNEADVQGNAVAVNEDGQKNVINGENDIVNGDKVEYKENNINILKHKIIKQLQAEEVNNWWKTEKNLENSPYKPETYVDYTELTEDDKYNRVYDKDNSDMVGQWIMRAEDIKGLTPEQIKDKYALPFIPKFICDVELYIGTQLRTGIANEIKGWGKGGGIQSDLMGQIIGDFINQRLLK